MNLYSLYIQAVTWNAESNILNKENDPTYLVTNL